MCLPDADAECHTVGGQDLHCGQDDLQGPGVGVLDMDHCRLQPLSAGRQRIGRRSLCHWLKGIASGKKGLCHFRRGVCTPGDLEHRLIRAGRCGAQTGGTTGTAEGGMQPLTLNPKPWTLNPES